MSPSGLQAKENSGCIVGGYIVLQDNIVQQSSVAAKETTLRTKFLGTLRTLIYSVKFIKYCGKLVILWGNNFILTS